VTQYRLGSEPEDHEVTSYESWMEVGPPIKPRYSCGSVTKAFSQMLYASQLLYVLSVGLSKCSATLFLGNLSRNKKHTTAASALTTASIAWMIGSCLAVALRGPLATPWENVGSLVGWRFRVLYCVAKLFQWIRWLVIETIGLAIELAIWLFAFTLIWDLNAQLQRRVKLLMIFAARLMYVSCTMLTESRLTYVSSLIPIIAVRLARLKPSTYKHTIEEIISIAILVQLALHWSTTSECLTCLKPFLQTWHDGVPADSSTSHYWGSLSNALSDSGTKGRSGADKSFARTSVISRHHQANHGNGSGDGTLKLRADHSGYTTKIVSEEKPTWMPEAGADDAIELLPTSRIRVKTTTTLTSS
jgi:hypothetical protein